MSDLVCEKIMNAPKIINTRERCVPECMSGQIKTLQHHYARYNFALMYARNKHVLDASCGSGYGTGMMSDIATSVFGVDVSSEAIEYAKGRYKGNFEVVDLDESKLPGMFDIAISFETIEHLKNPEFFISNIKESCNEFLFSIPINDPNPYHINVWSLEQIVEMFSKFYTHVDWFHQAGLNIGKGLKSSKYIIGYAKTI